MIRVLVAFALAMLASSHADAVEARYTGAFQIVSVTENGKCTPWRPVGYQATARFRPQIPNVNPPGSYLSLFESFGARNFTLPNGLFNATFKTVDATNIFEEASTPSVPLQVRFVTQTPAQIVAATKAITITGEILNWDRQIGCRVQFSLVLYKRV
jgi:hypothetical protein